MTGYGQGLAEGGGVRVQVSMRGVNHRFADVKLRLPSSGAPLEAELRRRILATVRRGRVEMSLSVERTGGAAAGGALNRPLAEAVVAAADQVRRELGVEGELDIRSLFGVPGMVVADPVPDLASPEAAQAIDRAVGAAMEAFDAERRREGEALQADLRVRLARMQELAGGLDTRAGALPDQARSRLAERVRVLTAGTVELDPGRLAQEVALIADRGDTTEERVRLASHLEQTRALVAQPDGEPVGKRIDFLLQEIHRETNTIAAKAADLEVTRLTLELKSETEKVREQVQNLE